MNSFAFSLGSSGEASRNIGLFFVGFWRWWSRELKDLLPAELHRQKEEQNKFHILPQKDAVIIEYVSNGTGQRLQEESGLSNLPDESWEQIIEIYDGVKQRLFLEEGDYHIIKLELPKSAQNHLTTSVELQLAQLIPIRPGLVDWNIITLESERDHIKIALVYAKSEKINQLESLFAERGLMPPEFCVSIDDEIAVLRQPIEIEPPLLENHKFMGALIAAVMVAATPIVTIGGAELMSSFNMSNAEALEQKLRPRLAREKSIHRQEQARRSAAPIVRMADLSGLLETLAHELPDTMWISSSTQMPDGDIELLINMPSAQAEKGSLENDDLIGKFRMVEEVDSQSGRVLMRYKGAW